MNFPLTFRLLSKLKKDHLRNQGTHLENKAAKFSKETEMLQNLQSLKMNMITAMPCIFEVFNLFV